MAQTSIMWDTTGGIGDGASPYTATQLTTWIRRMLGNGVHAGYGGELAVSGVSSPLSVAYGAAVVNGFPYDAQSPGPYTIAVPTPSTGTTGHIVTVRAVWSTQTVRIALRSSADGTATFPTPVVNEGVESEILLAQVSITTGGVITVIDARDFLHYHTKIDSTMLDAGVALANLAADSVTAAKIANRTRTFFVPAISGLELVFSAALAPTQAGIEMADGTQIHAFGFFSCPADYQSGMTVAAVFTALATGNARISQEFDYGAVGEVFNTHVSGLQTTFATKAMTLNQYAVATPTSLSSVAIGDYVQCLAGRDGGDSLDTIGTNVYCLGFQVAYTADS